ncbi:MAG: hypothetical protein RBR69_09255 [Candidatus Cloacimonadaceae bacterium]|nr:hypothetical protein [Candidatus Cloacimonadota bacterium]MDY0128302.1 hypothetical protein [Candidatus Cloacimonadaceae bacterium]MCB5254061.1 hypothetical protein [Candidatus Cloacimonadota bacterium]MCK9179195.1 hypothetical protein [Candidatus Cloacimonadota bacterium]MCK9243589.1 hypothetical protein [Candidatus Cloacimonadota bacterium]
MLLPGTLNSYSAVLIFKAGLAGCERIQSSEWAICQARISFEGQEAFVN